MAFSDFLRSLRKRRNLTQEEFGRRVGTSQPFVSMLEGKGIKVPNSPPVKLLAVIGREFKLDIGERLEMIDSIIGIGEDNDRHAEKFQGENVFPLLWAIVMSGLSQLTPAELELLVKTQTALDVVIPSRAIRILIEERRSIQQPA